MKNEDEFTVEEIKKILKKHIYEWTSRGMFNAVIDYGMSGFDDAAKAIYEKYAG